MPEVASTQPSIQASKPAIEARPASMRAGKHVWKQKSRQTSKQGSEQASKQASKKALRAHWLPLSDSVGSRPQDTMVGQKPFEIYNQKKLQGPTGSD